MKSYAITISFVMIAGGTAYADPEPPMHRLSIEQDPLAYLVHGWDAMIAYQHPALPHARATLSVYSAYDEPTQFLSDGFHCRTYGVTTLLVYTRGAGGRGWMAGAQIAVVNEDYTNDAGPGHETIDQLIVGPIVGYRWFPFDHGLFIYPWARLAVSFPIHGDRSIMVGGKTMETTLWSPIATFHLGYELTF